MHFKLFVRKHSILQHDNDLQLEQFLGNCKVLLELARALDQTPYGLSLLASLIEPNANAERRVWLQSYLIISVLETTSQDAKDSGFLPH
ncbi:MAG: hypothetical protein HPY52_17100 [Firmicutes bacterium]|nr:hypothetical protein [Bacillota bacterium]